jgi:hypothetical protein
MLRNVYNGAEDEELAHIVPEAARRLITAGLASFHTNVSVGKTNLDKFQS